MKIGNNNANAPLAFAAALGKKITLYPGVSGDVGFGVQGNLFQIYSDEVEISKPNYKIFQLVYNQIDILKAVEKKLQKPCDITAQCKPVEEREINRKLLLILNRLKGYSRK